MKQRSKEIRMSQYINTNELETLLNLTTKNQRVNMIFSQDPSVNMVVCTDPRVNMVYSRNMNINQVNKNR